MMQACEEVIIHGALDVNSPQANDEYAVNNADPGNEVGKVLLLQNSFKRLLQSINFNKKSLVPNGERSHLLNSDPMIVSDLPVMRRLRAAASWRRCLSLPVRPASKFPRSVSASALGRLVSDESHKANKGLAHRVASRSLSLPGRNVIIVRSLSLGTRGDQNPRAFSDDQLSPDPGECNDDEQIPIDEAICRICLDECEEGTALIMECQCKGALQLVHEDCALKWFSMKGNKSCDVCGEEVKNLPVTLLPVMNYAQTNDIQEPSQQIPRRPTLNPWQDFALLVFISTICYFFFLEQLLIRRMKAQAIIIAAPFAFILGLLASVFAAIFAMKEYVWTYGAFEFVILAIYIQFFHSVIHLKEINAIVISSVLGFVTSMSLNSLYIYYFAWQAQVLDTAY